MLQYNNGPIINVTTPIQYMNYLYPYPIDNTLQNHEYLYGITNDFINYMNKIFISNYYSSESTLFEMGNIFFPKNPLDDVRLMNHRTQFFLSGLNKLNSVYLFVCLFVFTYIFFQLCYIFMLIYIHTYIF